VTTSAIRDAAGAVIGVAVIARDITDRQAIEHELKFLADHDLLTGLFNRRRLTEELQRHVAHALRYPGGSGALLLGDLDTFKQINDSIGHKAGDELIASLAHVLAGRLRETDVLARLGGDEFAVLMPHADITQATQVAETLREAIGAFEMVIDGRPVRTTSSIGVTLIDPELSLTDIFAAADSAMYDAKRLGRNQVVAAHPSSGGGTRAAWSERLRAALAEHRFRLYAQPIVGIARPPGGRFELLIRLHEDEELISPAAFIYAAERFHLIEEIDRRVIARAIALIKADPAGRTAYHVNVSAVTLVDPDILGYVQQQISAAGVDSARLTIEITETAAITDLDAAQRFARGLREVGCGLALDDFGSGFGSFSYLRRVAVQFIKIDDSFINGLAQSASDRVIVQAIVEVAHGLNAEVVAEHVRDEPTRAMLQRYGVDYGQGYHFGRPEPLAASPPSAALQL
jgi:diguanylate cyclase (GGDEF)-like protein